MKLRLRNNSKQDRAYWVIGANEQPIGLLEPAFERGAWLLTWYDNPVSQRFESFDEAVRFTTSPQYQVYAVRADGGESLAVGQPQHSEAEAHQLCETVAAIMDREVYTAVEFCEVGHE